MGEKETTQKGRRTFAKDYIGWRVYALIKFVICALPLWATYCLAVIVGECLYWLAKTNRKTVGN
ncbi:unnamed protein product, partial [marine sediment metagenome]